MQQSSTIDITLTSDLSQHLKTIGIFAVNNMRRVLLPPKDGYLVYDKEAKMYYIDQTLLLHLTQIGLFAVKSAAVVLTAYAFFQSLRN